MKTHFFILLSAVTIHFFISCKKEKEPEPKKTILSDVETVGTSNGNIKIKNAQQGDTIKSKNKGFNANDFKKWYENSKYPEMLDTLDKEAIADSVRKEVEKINSK